MTDSKHAQFINELVEVETLHSDLQDSKDLLSDLSDLDELLKDMDLAINEEDFKELDNELELMTKDPFYFNHEGRELVTQLELKISTLEEEVKELNTKRKQDYLDYLEVVDLLEQTQAKLIKLESQ